MPRDHSVFKPRNNQDGATMTNPDPSPHSERSSATSCSHWPHRTRLTPGLVFAEGKVTLQNALRPVHSLSGFEPVGELRILRFEAGAFDLSAYEMSEFESNLTLSVV